MFATLIRFLFAGVGASALCLAMVACDGSSSSSNGTTPTAAAAALPPGLFVTEAGAGATDLKQVIDNAADGDKVTVKAYLGGQVKVFVANRAMMILADHTLPDCSSYEDDHCPTPWDACCEPSDVISASTATVQVVDDDGKLLATSLADAGGLKPGIHVVVEGIVKRADAKAPVTINATGIYVETEKAAN